ncbi:YdiU/UPF0061 family uncharacterized protein [Vibrio sp. ES.051]|uniref:protein adenylyltransferase SelO family protein n=1 Tax=Vibrio sp. ES.051 TaxID=1761909 RepID=UPI000BFA733D|nr:protein adenylyltransferase SelO family protein [Vibrio sp. ES.051]PFG56474.1 YdiU/UPF0061 family uncharacterized protein [Vibrio sp. ES.051]
MFNNVTEVTTSKCDVFNKKLPTISFVPFECRRLKGAEVVWLNKELLRLYGISGQIEEIENLLLDEFAYVSDGYTEDYRLLGERRKVFWADRYGSRHEVCNGGSARCGFDGAFQVKGIGITPLLAQNMSESHSTGKLFLDEAISEAIWGEICQKHLPLGAIRTVAIIKTNVEQEFLYLDDKPKKPCALAIREFAIRPAHFERATFFWPSYDNKKLRLNDANRVREAIKYLNIASEVGNEELSTKDELLTCLDSLISKIAKQIAYSRIKGIPHGSLTSSNIGIDGRFLDFGTITAVPDFGNYVLADGVGAVWDDHLLITNWLQNIITTLNNYTTFEDSISKTEEKRLIDQFLNHLNYHENFALLDELGVEEKDAENLKLAFKLKESFVSLHRRVLGDFNADDFIETIVRSAKEEGLKVGDISFKLRKFKYSSFKILNDKNVIKSGYTKCSVNELIEYYCKG